MGQLPGSNEAPSARRRAESFADRLVDRARAFAPLVAIAVLLSGVGWFVQTRVGLAGALDGADVFFQIVLAGSLMALLRNEVGLRTYGLFAPVVIAFIMVAAGPLWGLVLFLNVLVVTLVAHKAVQPLKLGTAPRVAVLLSVAGLATALAFAAAAAGQLPAAVGSGEVFFPTIISAWYADRAATEVEERGWREPAKRLLGTLVAVALSFAVISNAALVDWFTTTPAAWGAILLVVAYLGSRPGFRVSELRRFDDHFGGGPLSAARARLRYRLTTLRRRLAAAMGRDVRSDLSEAEVLSMKRRNRYIEAYNPPHVRPAADEKAETNRRLSGLGIESPRTYAVVEDTTETDAAARVVEEREEFVVKPSKGYGGEGIVVVSGRDGDVYDTSKGEMTARELNDHVRRIVDGHYSGLESEGTAIVEEKLTPAEFMRELHGDGVADVRVIVFQGYPVMAMTRLPTEASDGAANLHLGAVGVGLNVADGTPIKAFQQSRDRTLTEHPDTGTSLTDFRMPNWDAVLETAVEAAAASGLGYTGVDVVLGEGNTPKVLEVNVRPGLGIQNTTERGIFGRLEFVERLPNEFGFLDSEAKIELAREWSEAGFAAEALPGPDDLPVDAADATEAERETESPTGTERTADTAPSTGPAAATDDTTVADSAEGTASPDPADGASADDGDAGTDLREKLFGKTGSRLIAGGTALGGLWLLGLPLLAALLVVNAVAFVGGLCARAFGIRGVAE